MSPPLEDVTDWLEHLKAGDADAAQPLWQAFFQRLVTMARARLRGVSSAVGEEEDVALSAFDSFYRGVEAGRFPRLDDRHDLWQVLVMLAARKAIDRARRAGRQKRGGGLMQRADALDGLACREPTPEEAALLAEECVQRLARLGDGELRQVALWKMEGFTNAEIAGRGVSG
jgi:DNA-directed RNA polymerase specialized sigma24 family protein